MSASPSSRVNDFVIKIATVNGTGSASANGLLMKSIFRTGIPVMCHNFMAVQGWLRTSMAVPARGGALVTGYNHELMAKAPQTEAGEVSEQQLWDGLQ